MKRKVVKNSTVIFLLLFTTVARAQDTASSDEATKKAETYFQRGRVLFEEEDYTAAAEAFALAYETAPHPAVLANLALSYDRAGNIPKAVETYRRYLNSPINTEKNEQMKTRLDELSLMVADLSLTCTADPCRISIDDVLIGEAPIEIVVMAGEHRIEAFDGEIELFSTTIQAAGGTKHSQEITAPASVDEQSTPTSEDGQTNPGIKEQTEDERPKLRAPFWISAGLTLAGGAGIAVFGALATNRHSTYEDSGNTDPEAKTDGERYKLLTNIMIGVTAAAGATAIVLAIIDVKRESNNTVALVPGPHLGAGVAIRF